MAMYVSNLDDVISRSSLKEGIVVFRGTRGPVFEKLKAQKEKVGLLLQDDAFVSTSTSLDIATGFTHGKGMVFEVRVPTGSNALHVSSNGGVASIEQEVLLPRNTKFIITDTYEDKKQGVIVYKADLVP